MLMVKNKKFRHFLYTVCFFIFFLFNVSRAESAKNIPQLDDRFTYDIYFSGYNQQVSVVRNVKVVRFQEIGSKTFMVLKLGVFSLQDSEGFILLDAITAILPNREFHIDPAGVEVNR